MEANLIAALPPFCYYIPEFISSEEEDRLVSEIQRQPGSRWTVLSHRRLLSLPSQLTGAKRDTLLSAPLPNFLAGVVTKFLDRGIFTASPHQQPNHVLINEYKPGEGIMPHEDGPAYHPTTATVSLASHTVLEIYKKSPDGEREARPSWRILQEPRSLLVTTGDMYAQTLHGISELEADTQLDEEHIANWALLSDKATYSEGEVQRKTRVSLTFRDVLKVAKVGGALKFMQPK